MSAMEKPYSEACARNSEPIVGVLVRAFAQAHRVLEIGSGTGQHAVHFARRLPHLQWQPSDVAAHLPGIRAWIADVPAPNLRAPLQLDVNVDPWPERGFDGVFSANTAHIMSWDEAQRMVARAAAALDGAGRFCLYGPFNYGGAHTSDSNARFDAALRARDPRMGLRDMEALDAAAARHGFVLEEDNAMPANNRLLVWRMQQGGSTT
jgi:SAM-dependent methyltransferase